MACDANMVRSSSNGICEVIQQTGRVKSCQQEVWEGVGHCVQTGALAGRASLDVSERCESLMLPKAQSAQVSPTHRPAFAPAKRQPASV
jgi:hypothetical protein